jgi:uncharacterized protein (TIGR00255 family)
VKTPLRSMTGFAMVRRRTTAGELTLSLRSVNHRGLDLHFHQSSELAQFENEMRDVLKRKIARGHVEVRGHLSRADSNEQAVYNRALLARYVAAFRQAAKEHGLRGEPDLNAAFSVSGMLNGDGEPSRPDASFVSDVVYAITSCADELNAYREREAGELLSAFEQEIHDIEQNTRAIAEIRLAATEHFQEKLNQRLKELLGQSGVPEARLLEEAALLADRSDIQEEVTRLRVHVGELQEILAGGGEVGKRIDFLLQEMNRETNTMLSKTSGIGEIGLTVTNLALAIKAHIEKIREQALNLE